MDKKTEFFTRLVIAIAVAGTITPIVYSRSETVIYFWECTTSIRECNLAMAVIFFMIATIVAFGITYILTSMYGLVNRKTKKVIAHLTFDEFPQNMGVVPYLSLKLYNHEQDEIEECYGTLLELENLYTPTVTIPILETVNPNSKFLSWGGGSISEQVAIPRSDGVHPGVKVLNIAKGGGDVVFLFHGQESNYHGMNFRAKIKIDGEINGKSIEPIVTEFCFKYGINIYSTRHTEPKIGEKQRIVIIASDVKSRFSFEDCDKIWKNNNLTT